MSKRCVHHLCLVLLFASLVMETGCCRMRQMDQPKLPDKIKGWKAEHVGNSTFIAELILKKDEPQDNGEIGVKLLNIQHTPCKSSLSMEDSDPKIVLQFYNPQNKQVICQTQSISGGFWDFFAISACKNRLTIDSIVIYKINSKDGWIHLGLFQSDRKTNE